MISNTELFYAKAKSFQDKRAALVSEYEKNIKGLERFRGSAGYDEETKRIKAKLDADLKNLVDEYRPAFMSIIDGMTASVGRRNMPSPTEEQLRILQMLKMKKRLSADDISRAAQSVKDSRLALDILAEIAAEHKLPHSGLYELCPEISTEAALRAVDNLKSGIDDFLRFDTKRVSRIAADYYNKVYGSTDTKLPKRDLFTDRAGCFWEIGRIGTDALDALTPILNA